MKENKTKLFIIEIVIIGVVIYFITANFFQICFVNGDSMYPTLKNMDLAVMKKYDMQLKRNDIVVIKKDNKVIIKRIIAVPYDKVSIDKYVYVNDEKFDELYIENRGDINSDIVLGEKQYFVLGDNRQNSTDSRFEEIGIINEDEIIGKIMWK